MATNNKPYDREKKVVTFTNAMQQFTNKMVYEGGYKLGDLKAIVDGLVNFHGPDVSMVIEIDYYDNETTFFLKGKRLETDLEHAARLARHDRLAKNKENAAERAVEKAAKQHAKRVDAILAEAAKLGLNVTPK